MTNQILEQNITSIIRNNIFIAKELLDLDFNELSEGIFTEISADGNSIVSIRLDGNNFLLHSQYDPSAEAKRIVKDIEEKRDYLILLFGIGLGYHLFELKKRISPGTRVIIIEHNMDVLKYTLNHVDLSQIFESGQFILVFGDEKQVGKIALSLAGLGLHNLVHNILVLVLPNYYIYSAQNKSALHNISKCLLNTVLAAGNDLEDHFFGFSNMCYNTETIMKGHSIDEIKGKYKNMPAIIVAAGPSLDNNIQYLKKANGKALIIACDASMRACEKHGVQPDAIASIERVEPTYTFYYKDRKFPEDLVLLAPGSIWPAIYEEFNGEKIIMSRNDKGFEQIWMSVFENLSFVNQGHSCATVAFATARQAGCNPIILIGQDLAYTSGKKHSELTHTVYEGENNDRDSNDIYVEDHEGNLLKSSIVYKLFKEWYELQLLLDNNLKVIDATEGGAYIKGTTLMTLQESIREYCNTPIEKRLVEYLQERKISYEDKLKKYNEVIKIMNNDLSVLKKIKKSAKAHLNMLIKTESIIGQNVSDKQLESMVLKMQRGDQIIGDIIKADSIEAYYSPIIMHTIIQVKKIGNTLTMESVRRNHLLQKNLMYMIIKSTDLIMREYNQAKIILETKKKQLGYFIAEKVE
ncbi:hypothetical protein Desor_4909 [Desulfosporosinus orientis DSM 765]|uniref:Motility accessory factor n=1 Tax=Desulfosporosinus orientis (strain ATCC 19365 / DSM 765 / NCIMB 8382 / VKM B-1628 / Singapore I) TaxID=768706 RepID=G7WI13_DESOD|nr:6-hydroxymethylpterin diphosphokinase MptE-like protein [Desulfosporosinus orientis]AET70310.1 hypothetical protein Desor_4909 [Desulfosporosinus orientis DSM 765]